METHSVANQEYWEVILAQTKPDINYECADFPIREKSMEDLPRPLLENFEKTYNTVKS